MSSRQLLTSSNFQNKPSLSTNKSVPHLENLKNNTPQQEINLTQRKRRHTENWDNIRSSRANEESISFSEFKILLSTTNSGPIDWEFDSKDEGKEITILETEYHIIRQILMIMNRQLDDLAISFSHLQKYSASQLMNFLLNLGEGRTQTLSLIHI